MIRLVLILLICNLLIPIPQLASAGNGFAGTPRFQVNPSEYFAGVRRAAAAIGEEIKNETGLDIYYYLKEGINQEAAELKFLYRDPQTGELKELTKEILQKFVKDNQVTKDILRRIYDQKLNTKGVGAMVARRIKMVKGLNSGGGLGETARGKPLPRPPISLMSRLVRGLLWPLPFGTVTGPEESLNLDLKMEIVNRSIEKRQQEIARLIAERDQRERENPDDPSLPELQKKLREELQKQMATLNERRELQSRR